MAEAALVLHLRAEAAQFKKVMAEVRAEIQATRNAASGGASAGARSAGGSPSGGGRTSRTDASSEVQRYRIISAAAKASANEIIGSNRAITAMAKSTAAQQIAAAQSGAAEDKRASLSRIAAAKEASAAQIAGSKAGVAEDKRASIARIAAANEASAAQIAAARSGMAEDKRSAAARLQSARAGSAEDKRASASRIAATKEASAAEIAGSRSSKAAADARAAATREATAAIRQQTAEIQRQKAEQAALTGGVRNHSSALGQALKTAAQLWIVYKGLHAAADAFKAGINYQATLEGAQLAIASVVSANEKIVDSQGRQIEGVEKLKIAQSQVSTIMEQLRVKAIETGTPIQTLVSGFQAAVAPASAMGLTLDQTRDVVVGMTNAMKAMNVPLDQQRQEIQDILNADIDRNSHVAKNLQLNSAVLNVWKEQGTLAQNLLTLLKDYNVAAGEFKNTWGGATAILKGNFEALMGSMTTESFKALKDEAKKISEIFSSDEARADAYRFGTSLADGLRIALTVAESIANVVSKPIRLQAAAGASQKADRVADMTRTETFLRNMQSQMVTPGQERAMAEGRDPGKMSGRFTAEDVRKTTIAREESRTVEDFIARLKKEGFLGSQIQAAQGAFINANRAAENARVKTLGFPGENLDELGRPVTGAKGVKITPAGGVGISPKVTAAAKVKLERDLERAKSSAHGDEVKAVNNRIDVIKAAQAEVKKTGLDAGKLAHELLVAEDNLTTAINDRNEKAAKAAAAAADKVNKAAKRQDLAALKTEFKTQLDVAQESGTGNAGQIAAIDEFVTKQGISTLPPNFVQEVYGKREAAVTGKKFEEAAPERAFGLEVDRTMLGLRTGAKEGAVSRDLFALEEEKIKRTTQIRLDAAREEAKILDDAAKREPEGSDSRLALEIEAARFRSIEIEKINAKDREARLDLEAEVGQVRLQLAQKAASLAAGALTGAISGEGMDSAGVLKGGASLMGGAIGSLAGPMGAAIGETAGGIIGDVVIAAANREKNIEKFREGISQFRKEGEQYRGSVADGLGIDRGVSDAFTAAKAAEDVVVRRKTELAVAKSRIGMDTGFEEWQLEAAEKQLAAANKNLEGAAKTADYRRKDAETAEMFRKSVAEMNTNFRSQAESTALGTAYSKLDTKKSAELRALKPLKATNPRAYEEAAAAIERGDVSARSELAVKAETIKNKENVMGIASKVYQNSRLGKGSGLFDEGTFEVAASQAADAFRSGATIAEVSGMGDFGGNTIADFFTPEALKAIQETSLGSKANLESITERGNAELAEINDALKESLEKGTERNPMVIQPPRNSNFAFMDRNQLLAQRRSGASRALNLAGNARAL